MRKGVATLATMAVLSGGPAWSLDPGACVPPKGAASSYLDRHTPIPLDDGFVYYDAVEVGRGALVSVLEYCPTRQVLALRVPFASGQGGVAEQDAAAQSRFLDMVFGEERFTMAEMASELAAMGAAPTLSTGPQPSCACLYAQESD